MRTEKELRESCAKLISDLRQQHGLSIAQMAKELGIDSHTLRRYENGKSTPDIVEFIRMFDMLGHSAMKDFLNLIYPETYAGDCTNSETAKESLNHFLHEVASEHMIKEMYYLFVGDHGSNIAPQLEMFTMINHLPMSYRYMVAKMVSTLYELAYEKGELINTDHVMPDLDIFVDGLIKGREASILGRSGYTTVSDNKREE